MLGIRFQRTPRQMASSEILTPPVAEELDNNRVAVRELGQARLAEVWLDRIAACDLQMDLRFAKRQQRLAGSGQSMNGKFVRHRLAAPLEQDERVPGDDRHFMIEAGQRSCEQGAPNPRGRSRGGWPLAPWFARIAEDQEKNTTNLLDPPSPVTVCQLWLK